MTTGTTRTYRRGDSIRKLSARGLNRAIVAGNAYHEGRFDGATGLPTGSSRDRTTVLIKNTLPDPLQRFTCVDLTQPVFLPDEDGSNGAPNETTDQAIARAREAFFGSMIFKINRPDFTRLPRRHVILTTPCAKNEIARAVLRGVVHCWIDVKKTWHRRASAIDNVTDKLESHPSGFAEILWKDDGTGLVPAIIDVGPFVSLSFDAVAKGDITPGETNNVVTLWDDRKSTSEDVSNVAFDWIHGDQKISDGKRVRVTWNPVRRLWDISDADCE